MRNANSLAYFFKCFLPTTCTLVRQYSVLRRSWLKLTKTCAALPFNADAVVRLNLSGTSISDFAFFIFA